MQLATDVMDTVYEYYIHMNKQLKRPVLFNEFYNILRTKYKIDYNMGMLLIYRPDNNTVHAFRKVTCRGRWYDFKRLKNFFSQLPQDVIAPVEKDINTGSKRSLEKLGFVCIKETDTHYFMQRNLK